MRAAAEAAPGGSAASFRRAHLLMLLLVGVAGSLAIALGERFPFGFLWDTDWYADEAAHLWRRLVVEGLDGYRLQRVLPSALVHAGMRLAGTPLDVERAGTAFALLDLALMALSAWLWKGVADELRLSLRARWLGFLGLFVNFAALKHAWYMPALTDVPAFATGMLALRFFLARRQLALAAVGIAGGFVFPTAGPTTALLLLWPRGEAAPGSREPGRRSPVALPTIAAFGVALLFVAAFSYRYFVNGNTKAGFGPVAPVVATLLPLSLAVTFLHVFLGLRTLGRGLDGRWVVDAFRSLRPASLLLAMLVLVLPRLIVRMLQSAPATVMTPRAFLGFVTFLPNTRPWVQVVAHVAWLGPLVVLMVLRWPAICRATRRLGAGAVLALAFSFLVAMTPESRQSSFAWPLLVALAVSAADAERAISKAMLAAMAALSVALSSFWVTLNTPEMLAGPRGPVLDDARAAHVFREYFVRAGPWMPNDAYAWWALAVVAVMLLLLAVARLERRGAVSGRAAAEPSPNQA